MFNKLLSKVFGTSNDRVVSSMYPIVDEINSYEPKLKELSDIIEPKVYEYGFLKR